jgi:hypothetical protein
VSKPNSLEDKPMWIRSAVTVVLSVVLSVAATLVVDRPIKRAASDTIRAKKIELIDNEGKVRGAFKLGVWAEGRAEPMIVFIDDHGNESVNLQLNTRGEGTLYFNSHKSTNFRDGIVRVGYLQFDDSGATEDPLGAWGIVVEDSKRTATSMGLKSSGAPLGLSVASGGRDVGR